MQLLRTRSLWLRVATLCNTNSQSSLTKKGNGKQNIKIRASHPRNDLICIHKLSLIQNFAELLAFIASECVKMCLALWLVSTKIVNRHLQTKPERRQSAHRTAVLLLDVPFHNGDALFDGQSTFLCWHYILLAAKQQKIKGNRNSSYRNRLTAQLFLNKYFLMMRWSKKSDEKIRKWFWALGFGIPALTSLERKFKINNLGCKNLEQF